MIFIEMSREISHGGGSWSFPNCVWAPIRKRNGARWPYWSNILKIQTGDIIIHLRGINQNAEFVGYSMATSDGFQTDKKPPNPTIWSDFQFFYKANLESFTAFSTPINIKRLFEKRKKDLIEFYMKNKENDSEKINLFYVYQSKRLQCLNGAYLSEANENLLNALFGTEEISNFQIKEKIQTEVFTDSQLSLLKTRIGQQKFANEVKCQYGQRCCFPGCDITDNRFLVASHIARWSDNENLRGNLGNGLCFCILHDKAFEIGLFSINESLEIVINHNQSSDDKKILQNLQNHEGEKITNSKNPPLFEALVEHWNRVNIDIDWFEKHN